MTHNTGHGIFWVLAIKSIKHKGLKRSFEAGDSRKLNQNHVSRIEQILDDLDSATAAQDMDQPGYHLHPLKGDLKDHWSVRVSANLRITFRFEGWNAYDVDLTDYH